jgi:hypothetical protein
MALEHRQQELESLPLHPPQKVESQSDKEDDDRSTTASVASQASEGVSDTKPEDESRLSTIGLENIFAANQFVEPDMGADAFMLGYAFGQMSPMMSAPMWNFPVLVACNPPPDARRRKKGRSLITIAAKHGNKLNPKSKSATHGQLQESCQQPPKAQTGFQDAPKVLPPSEDATCSSCGHCGGQMQSHFRFCHHCGKAVSDSKKAQQKCDAESAPVHK